MILSFILVEEGPNSHCRIFLVSFQLIRFSHSRILAFVLSPVQVFAEREREKLLVEKIFFEFL